ncbi:hypothetical protein N7E02_08230 [Aliirhizobium terrae]|uniref:AAA family ATPase n=1 Tax=Terrirhizobium terrae TaxID=2926709 RepID=UPI002578EA36|nr:hypothetical protein [Rhizobium sp. CC-CFT758]WJH40592.1 hypothetical protein N7E02_08230 [Rhizobium sp. CC-CFT758]
MSDVSPAALIGNTEIFGQHEISELTRHPDKLAEILRRFTSGDTHFGGDRRILCDKLGKSRKEINSRKSDLDKIEEQLSALPGLRANLARFATAGLEERLSEKSGFDREVRIFSSAFGAAEDLVSAAAALAPPEDGSRVLPPDDVDLPSRSLLEKLDQIAARLDEAKIKAAADLEAAAAAAKTEITAVQAEWTPLQEAAERRFGNLVRELESEGHEPRKFVSFQDQVEALKPKEVEKQNLVAELQALRTTRADLLVDWERIKAQDFRALERAAHKVSKRLENRVRVRVRQNSNLAPLETILRQRVGGNLTAALEKLKDRDALGLTDLANTIRAGSQALQTAYGFTSAGADRIAQHGDVLALEIEECELPPEAVVELNVGPEGSQTWKQLDDLSTGQKATAVLLLLLLESEAPLIVDQPEDDLDNRFIADSIVPAMRVEKRRRQFIFSSHNANIPVLGDAEQIIGLQPIVDGGIERTIISEDLSGSIDAPKVKDLVKKLLEGGQRAFTTRREKYGF